MAGKGGYQAPAHPAAVSGVGRQSRRTDGTVADQAKRYIPTGESGTWGDATDLNKLQSAAPMDAAPGMPPAAPVQQGMPPQGQQLTPLDAPTQRPDEHVATPPSALQSGAPDRVADAIRNAYAQLQSPELGAMMSQLEAQGR